MNHGMTGSAFRVKHGGGWSRISSNSFLILATRILATMAQDWKSQHAIRYSGATASCIGPVLRWNCRIRLRAIGATKKGCLWRWGMRLLGRNLPTPTRARRWWRGAWWQWIVLLIFWRCRRAHGEKICDI